MLDSATSVRPAQASDARAIASVHVASWLTTYRGLMPESVLQSLSVENRERRWTETLANIGSFTLVGCDSRQQIVGFVSGGAERSGELRCDGELYAIYLLAEAQGKGLGRLLVTQLVDELKARGFRSMAVWVLAANLSRRFYEALGGIVVGRKDIEIGGETFEELAYGWTDLNRF